jgi:hypothetical protein
MDHMSVRVTAVELLCRCRVRVTFSDGAHRLRDFANWLGSLRMASKTGPVKSGCKTAHRRRAGSALLAEWRRRRPAPRRHLVGSNCEPLPSTRQNMGRVGSMKGHEDPAVGTILGEAVVLEKSIDIAAASAALV